MLLMNTYLVDLHILYILSLFCLYNYRKLVRVHLCVWFIYIIYSRNVLLNKFCKA